VGRAFLVMSCPAGRASRTRPTVIAAVVVRFVAYWEMLYSPPDAQPSAALRGRPASALGFFWGLRKGFACGPQPTDSRLGTDPFWLSLWHKFCSVGCASSCRRCLGPAGRFVAWGPVCAVPSRWSGRRPRTLRPRSFSQGRCAGFRTPGLCAGGQKVVGASDLPPTAPPTFCESRRGTQGRES